MSETTCTPAPEGHDDAEPFSDDYLAGYQAAQREVKKYLDERLKAVVDGLPGPKRPPVPFSLRGE